MKTYKSSQQIEKDIDSAYAKISKAKKVAQEHLEAEELLSGSEDLEELRKHRELADKQFRKIKRLEAVRLPKLKEKLQEFNTLTLPGVESPNNATESVPQPPQEVPI